MRLSVYFFVVLLICGCGRQATSFSQADDNYRAELSVYRSMIAEYSNFTAGQTPGTIDYVAGIQPREHKIHWQLATVIQAMKLRSKAWSNEHQNEPEPECERP